MRVVETKHGKYEVRFQHYRYFMLPVGTESGVSSLHPLVPNYKGGETECSVYFYKRSKILKRVSAKFIFAHGLAKCDFLDDYRHEVGEAKSLARAIRDLHFNDRRKRADFWAAWEKKGEE